MSPNHPTYTEVFYGCCILLAAVITGMLIGLWLATRKEKNDIKRFPSAGEPKRKSLYAKHAMLLFITDPDGLSNFWIWFFGVIAFLAILVIIFWGWSLFKAAKDADEEIERRRQRRLAEEDNIHYYPDAHLKVVDSADKATPKII